MLGIKILDDLVIPHVFLILVFHLSIQCSAWHIASSPRMKSAEVDDLSVSGRTKLRKRKDILSLLLIYLICILPVSPFLSPCPLSLYSLPLSLSHSLSLSTSPSFNMCLNSPTPSLHVVILYDISRPGENPKTLPNIFHPFSNPLSNIEVGAQKEILFGIQTF